MLSATDRSRQPRPGNPGARSTEVAEKRGSRCRGSFTNGVRPNPQWFLLGILVTMLAPGPAPGATNHILAAMADAPQAATSICMGHVDPSDSPIGQLMARLRGGRHRSEAAAAHESPQLRVSPSPKQVILRRTPGPTMSGADVLAGPEDHDIRASSDVHMGIVRGGSSNLAGLENKAFPANLKRSSASIDPARSFKDVVVQEEDKGKDGFENLGKDACSGTSHVSDVSSAGAPASAESLPFSKDEQNAAGMFGSACATKQASLKF